MEMSLWSLFSEREREQMFGGGGWFSFNYRVLIWRHLQSSVRSARAHPDQGFIAGAGLSGSWGGGAAPSVAQQASSKVEVLILTGVRR